MQARQLNTLATFRRIQDWLANRADLTGVTSGAGSTVPALSTGVAGTAAPTTSIGQQSALLDSAISDAGTEASEHDGFTRSILGYSQEAKSLRKEIVSGQMVHVATIARLAIPDVVRMTEAFRVPKVSRRTEALLAAAEAMAKAGDDYKDKLVAGGLSADFPEQLRNAAAALKDVVSARGSSVANRKGASTGFHEALVRGRKAVDTMTVLIKRQLKGDKATIAAWMQLRRVPKVGVRTDTGAAAVAAPATGSGTATAAATAPEQQKAAA